MQYQKLTSKDVEILERETVFRGHFQIARYRLKHRLFKGGWSQEIVRERFERGNAVGVLLFDPHLNKLVLVEQFRVGVLGQDDCPWLIELVAGVVELNEIPIEVARREVREEAGLAVEAILPIQEYWASPGGTTEKVFLFCAKVDAKKANGIHGLPEEGEDIRVMTVDVQEAYEWLESGRIANALSVIALQWFKLNEAKVRERFKQPLPL